MMTDVIENSPAGFWRRFASVLIDGMLFMPLSLAGLYILLVHSELYLLYMAINLLILAVYYTLMVSSRWQATIGMRVMAVYGVDEHEQKLKHRHTLKWLAISMGFFLLSYLPMFIIVPPGSSFEEQMKATQTASYWYAMLFSYVFLFVWALTIGLSKRRVGLHNRLAKVRFLKGRV